MGNCIETSHDIVIVFVEGTLQISMKDRSFPVNAWQQDYLFPKADT